MRKEKMTEVVNGESIYRFAYCCVGGTYKVDLVINVVNGEINRFSVKLFRIINKTEISEIKEEIYNDNSTKRFWESLLFHLEHMPMSDFLDMASELKGGETFERVIREEIVLRMGELEEKMAPLKEEYRNLYNLFKPLKREYRYFNEILYFNNILNSY